MLKNFIFIVIIILSFSNCRHSHLHKDSGIVLKEKGSETDLSESKKYTELDFELSDLYCWVNLMPGSAPSFHLKGEIIFPDSIFDRYGTINLTSIKILQQEIVFYSFTPGVREVKDSLDLNQKRIIFSLNKGLKLKPSFEYDNPIDVELFFTAEGIWYSKLIKNVNVDKAY